MPYRPHPVKTALAARGETQVECAAAVAVGQGTLAHVLNGRQASWPALRERLAAHLGIAEADLFPDDHLSELAV